jgi:hypothetical protein
VYGSVPDFACQPTPLSLSGFLVLKKPYMVLIESSPRREAAIVKTTLNRRLPISSYRRNQQKSRDLKGHEK